MAQKDLTPVLALATRLRQALQYVYYGDPATVEAVVATALAGGHLLILGPVGIGKTTLAKALAYSIGGAFKRIQATNETLPSDVLGYIVYARDGGRYLIRGPIFANVVLIDEINRMPPRSLSALIEAMQEGKVTIEGEELALPQPHIVIATANLQELGLAQIPLAVLDRFTTSIYVEKPDPTLEKIVVTEASDIEARLETLRKTPAATPAEAAAAVKALRSIKLDDKIASYIVELVEETRKALGVQLSVRASIHVAQLAKAFAALDSRTYVVPDDVKKAFNYALPHRIATRLDPHIYKDSPLKDILQKVPAPW
ncbi:MAG: MoxR family ATPase [Thermoproteus sp.]